jgi:hypothetical protein
MLEGTTPDHRRRFLMPWTAASANSYRLCLLDTNALSEIVKRPAVESRGFMERFPPEDYAPCFTVYSVIELRRSPVVYQKFLEFFSIYPKFMITLYNHIFESERTAYGPAAIDRVLFNAFTPLGKEKSYNLQSFMNHLFAMPEIARMEQQWRCDEQSTLDAWLKNAKSFQPHQDAPNARDAERYVERAATGTLLSIAPTWMRSYYLTFRTFPDIKTLPAHHITLYNLYYRLYDPSWKRAPQEVTDVRIMACAPYVDAIVTESFQANILEKVRKRVLGLQSVEITKLRDIRSKTA